MPTAEQIVRYRESARRWRLTHKKEAVEATRRWKTRNKDRVLSVTREWRAKNLEHVRIKNSEWRKHNPDKAKAQNKRSRQNNKETQKRWHTNYRKTSAKRRDDLSKSNKKYMRKPEARAKSLDGHLKREYGIGLEEYNARLLKQDSKCAICGGVNKDDRRLAVDHCHITGRVRGLLCHNCNHGIGMFHDSPELLAKVIAYLKY